VEKRIKAVEYILACFFKYPQDEPKRNKLIKKKVLQNEMIAVYGMYSASAFRLGTIWLCI
jgi:hypothetical protein